MESTYEQFRKLRDNLGYTQEEFAEILGVSPGTIYNWENERVEFTEKKLKAILQRAQYIKPKKEKIEQLRQDIANVINKSNHHPGINVWAEADLGGGKFIPSEHIEPLEKIEAANLISPQYTDAFRATGFSMIPVIRPNALCFVNFQDRAIRIGEIYAFNLPDEGLVIKELRKRKEPGQENEYLIYSYNEALFAPLGYSREELEAENFIVGRIILIHMLCNQ